jgi:lysyl-tRNA synthetase class 2
MTLDDSRPSAPLDALRARAHMLERLRQWFRGNGVLEVDTPALSHAAVTDVHLASVPAEVAGIGCMYLHTSPEYAMKRLLAAGIGDCYQVCHVYRDGEAGCHHNPEFTMVEWYRIGFDVSRLMDDVDSLARAVLAGVRELGPAERVTYRDAVRHLAGIDPMRDDSAAIAASLERHGVACPETAGTDRDALLDLLVATVVGPRLGRERPCFIHDYPATQAALARIRPGEFPVAERFELYIDGIELANGFHELGDGTEQRGRFEADLAERARRGLPAVPVDGRFLRALDEGFPDCAGVALGFDRLVMVARRASSLADVMAFPVDRA